MTKGGSTLVSATSLFLFMLLQLVMGASWARCPTASDDGRYWSRSVYLALFSTVPLLSALSEAHIASMAFTLIMTALAISSLYSSKDTQKTSRI